MGLSTYIEIFSPKKTGFSPVKNTSQNCFYFFLPLFYATFQCGPYNIFNKILNLFFIHENIKNGPQKLLIIGPKLFSQVRPGCPNQPRIDFSNYKYVPRLNCLRICAALYLRFTFPNIQ